MYNRLPTLLVGLSIAAVSCGDASLHVRMVIPDLYKAEVSSASLSVVVPPAGAPFSCDDIAFGTVSEEFVRANTVEEVLLQGSEDGKLDAIPRKGSKLFLAQGYDALGQPIVAGCLAFGAIQSDQTIEIVAQPITIATITAPIVPADVPGRETSVRITDTGGQPTPGIEVRWTRTAPGAAPENDVATSDEDGLVQVSIGLPPLPGPVAVGIHAKWARSEPPILVGFRSPPVVTSGEIPNANIDEARIQSPRFQVGRFGPSGEIGFSGLSNPDGNGLRQVLIVYYDKNTSEYISTQSELLPASITNLTMISEETHDRVIALGANTMVDVFPDGSTSLQTLQANGLLIRRVVPLGDCVDPTVVQSFLVEFTNGTRFAVDGTGQVIASLFSASEDLGSPVASGCLSDGGSLHRGVVFGDGEIATLLVNISGVSRQVTMGVVAAGVGFTPSTTSQDALLLATTLGIAGTDIVRFRILPIGEDLLEVEQITSDASPTFAQSIGAGDFDGDGITDIAAALSFGNVGEESVYRLYIALGLEAEGTRVVGLSTQQRGARPQIFVQDFDSDGHDDILVVTSTSYAVLSMGPVAANSE